MTSFSLLASSGRTKPISALCLVFLGLVLGCSLLFIRPVFAHERVPYSERDEVLEFIDRVVSKHQLDRSKLLSWLADATYKQSIIDAISRPAEKRFKWWEYRKIFLTAERIKKGVAFWLEHDLHLRKVAMEYQIDPEIIVAILGVETFYGQRAGKYRVIDSLATLGFDYPPRAKFFLGQLEEFLLLVQEQNKDPFDLKGSYAGAMGYGQFIPSSYRSFAVDFDKDGFKDIWSNVEDATASVANYLKEHKWKYQRPVVYPVTVTGNDFESFVNQGMRTKGIKKGTLVSEFKQLGVKTDLPDELQLALIRLEDQEGPKYWLADHNFFVITTYNISRLYAMAVYDLSQAITEAYCDSKAPRRRSRARSHQCQ